MTPAPTVLANGATRSNIMVLSLTMARSHHMVLSHSLARSTFLVLSPPVLLHRPIRWPDIIRMPQVLYHIRLWGQFVKVALVGHMMPVCQEELRGITLCPGMYMTVRQASLGIGSSLLVLWFLLQYCRCLVGIFSRLIIGLLISLALFIDLSINVILVTFDF